MLQSEGDQSGVEVGVKSEDRKFDEGGAGERRPKKKNRPHRDFCVKLTNLTRDIRVKDLKTELRKRECNPLSITWKGKWTRVTTSQDNKCAKLFNLMCRSLWKVFLALWKSQWRSEHPR